MSKDLETMIGFYQFCERYKRMSEDLTLIKNIEERRESLHELYKRISEERSKDWVLIGLYANMAKLAGLRQGE